MNWLRLTVILIALLPVAVGANERDIKDVYVVHFILDGANNDFFTSTLKAGKLPTIEEVFVTNGAVFTNAIGVFPSASTSAYQGFASGLLPGNAGLPFLGRFDRANREAIDYLSPKGFGRINTDFINYRALENPSETDLDKATTMFDLLQPHPTSAIYSNFSRNASFKTHMIYFLKTGWSKVVKHNLLESDVHAYRDLLTRFELPKEKIPRYSLVGLLATDFAGHEFGPKSKEVEDGFVQFDLFLKKFIELLKSRDILDKTYFVLCADHGMHDTKKKYDLKRDIERYGFKLETRGLVKKDADIYALLRGVSSTQIYILKETVSKDDLVANLQKIKGLSLIITKDGDESSIVYDTDGKSAKIRCTVLQSERWCSYIFEKDKGDPLNYSLNRELEPLLNGLPHPEREWLKYTADEEYPDAVTQFSQIFRDGRSGDVFVITKSDGLFRTKKLGTHGSAQKEDMRIPFLIAGPTVPKGTFKTMRSTDIYALLLEWFGLKFSPRDSDARSPFIPHSTNKDWQRVATLEQIFLDHPPLSKMIGLEIVLKNEIFPNISSSYFKRLLPLAKEEVQLRSKIASALKNKLNALPQEYEKRGVIEESYKKYFRASARMEDIATILEKCQNPNAISCKRL